MRTNKAQGLSGAPCPKAGVVRGANRSNLSVMTIQPTYVLPVPLGTVIGANAMIDACHYNTPLRFTPLTCSLWCKKS